MRYFPETWRGCATFRGRDVASLSALHTDELGFQMSWKKEVQGLAH
jgi:hypothetical protein